jgi:hypothetical protein
VHCVHPRGGERLETVDDRSNWAFVGADADLAVVGAHLFAEVLSDGLRLLAGLDVEVGGEHAACGLLEDHHRVPVVNVRRLQEAQAMLAQIEHSPSEKPRTLP